MKLRYLAGLGTVLCGSAACAVAAALGWRADALVLAAAGVYAAAQSRAVVRAEFGGQKRALGAQLALLGIALPLVHTAAGAALLAGSSAASVAVLLFSRTAVGSDNFAAGAVDWRSSTLVVRGFCSHAE